MPFNRYNNPGWEPYFQEIAPKLSRAYFATNIGILRRTIARLIFWKVGKIERRWFDD